MRYEEFMKKTIEEYSEKGTIDLKEFPDLELYIDQAALFLNRKLAVYQKEEGEEVITKTMIGNYAKHHMIPRPENKRYGKDHLILLTLIFYLKGNFQMHEIELLMKPLIDNYNSEFDDQIDLGELYDGIMKAQVPAREAMFDEISGDVQRIKRHLGDAELSDDDALELFMVISNLCMKADANRYLAQKLLNEYFVNGKKQR